MRGRVGLTAFVAAGLAVAFALAFFVGPEASGSPDGLNRVAIDEGFDVHEQDHALAGVPTAGYAVDGIDDERLSTGMAGLLGVAATFLLAGGLFVVVRRASSRRAPASPVAG